MLNIAQSNVYESVLIIASQAIMPFIALYLTSKVNAVFAGTFLIINIIVGFMVTFIGGYIGDNLSRKKVLNWAHILYAVILRIIKLIAYKICAQFNTFFRDKLSPI